MAFFRHLAAGIRALFHRERADQELDDELQQYLESVAERKMASGLTRAAAVRAARVEIGSLAAVKDGVLDVGWERRAEALWQDAGYAMRMMRRAPGLTAVVVLTIAVGVGAATSMFGVMQKLLLAPPPHVADPDRVFRLHQMFPPSGPQAQPHIGNRTSYPFYELLSARATSLAGIAAYTTGSDLAVGAGHEARLARTAMVSAGFWKMLGTRPVVGRFIEDHEAHPATGSRVVVLGHAFWQQRFHGRADALGRTLRIKGQPYEVIGVAPRGFRGTELADIDLWVPLFASGDGAGKVATWHTFSTSFNLVIAMRLKPGITVEQASAELTTLQRSFLTEAYGGMRSADAARDAELRERYDKARALLGSVTGAVGGDLRPIPEARMARWLLGLAFVLLAIACSNVAALLLLRAIRRGREIAVRLALGVTPGRLASQLLTESVVLAVLGGAAAVVTVVWSGAWLQRTLLPAIAWEPATLLDWKLIAMAVICTFGVAFVTGMAPLWYAKSGAVDALRVGVQRGPSRRPRLLNLLLIAQGALSVVLLVGAGLFLRSLREAQTVDIGLDRENVLAVDVDFAGAGRSPAEVAAFFERALERVSALPGVARASLASSIPLRSASGGSVRLPGREAPTVPTGGPYVNTVTPGFFVTTGMRIREGRDFREEDRARAAAIVVNETMARLYWPDRSPIGECVYLRRETTCATVIGVVADARRFNIIEEERYLYYYRPMERDETNPRALLVRIAPSAPRLEPAVRQALLEIDANLPFIKIQTLGQALNTQMRPWRLGASVFTAFGAIAVMLAVIGLASSSAYALSQRTQEFAVRMALGAQRASLVRLMLKDGIRGALAATVAGLVIARWGSAFIADLLFRVSPHDPTVFGVTAGGILVITSLATVLPAWRLTRIDPAVVLRAD
jgi:predicted permease